MKTIENNKLIAEFMGEEANEYANYSFPQHGYLKLNGEFKTDFKVSELKYHTSWDWLMLVAERIEEEENEDGYRYNVIIERDICKIEIDGRVIVHCAGNSFNNKLSSTFVAVVEFIKWEIMI